MPNLRPHLASVAAVLLVVAARAAAQDLHEDFEGAEPSWKIRGADVRYSVDNHQRVRQPAYRGAWSEALTITAGDGTQVLLGRPIGAARIIEELRISLAVVSDRPGIPLLARVVLPRVIDPGTGQPQTVLIYGTKYHDVGQWQVLTLTGMRQELERQTRILQAGRPDRIDQREAYVDAVMLNVYGGRGTTRVCIDELAVTGLVEHGKVVPLGDGPLQTGPLHDGAVKPVAHVGRGAGPVREVKLRGAVLSVDGRPFFPRLIEHRGEPLRKLRQLGFNGVKVFQHPDGALLAEAADAGMWIVCPPPPLAAGGAPLGPQFESVLAWNMGDALTQRELPDVEATIRRLRAADHDMRRPVVGSAVSDLSAYSERFDVTLMGRQALGTSLELSDLATWQQRRARLLRPGAPAWAWMETEADADALAQAAAFAGHPAPSTVGFGHLRQLALTAIATGSRGLVFASQTSLDGNAPETAERAAALRLLNMELALLEPWAAAGSFVMPATCSDPAVTATVLQTERSRLLLSLRFARGDQHELDEGPGGEVTFIVPGAAEANEAFELTAAGLRPLSRKRVAGGISVTLRDLAPAATIVLTQDAQVIDSLTRGAGQQRRSAADLARNITATELADVETIERRLAGQAQPAGAPRAWLHSAKERLRMAETALAAGDDPQALRLCRESQHWLAKLRRERWNEVAGALPSAAILPLAARYRTLPECAAMFPKLAAAAAGENLLAGGAFEDLDGLRRLGWRHTQFNQPAVVSDVALSPEGPHGGGHALRMRAVPQPGREPPTILEAPPVWIVTAPVALEPGTFVEIRGFVRVPRPIVGSVDGLLIVDSLGGEALAERVGQTRGWQQFILYRAAPRGGNLMVTFALSGIGEAFVDDVTIRPIRLGAAEAAPNRAGPGNAAASGTAPPAFPSPIAASHRW